MKPKILMFFLFVPSLFAHEGTHESIVRVSERIVKHPDDAQLHSIRAALLQDHGEPEKAEKDYRKALALDANMSQVHLGLGQLYLETGAFRKSLDNLDLYLDKNPKDEEARLFKARAHLGLMQYEKCIAEYNRLLQAATPKPAHFLERAEAQLIEAETGLSKVIEGLEEGIRKLGPLVVLEQRILELESRAGPSQKVFDRYDRLIRQSPIQWLEKKADYLSSLGRDEDARKVYTELLEELDRLPSRKLRAPRYAKLLKRVQKKLSQPR